MFYKQVIESSTSSKSLAKENTSKTFTIYNQYNNIRENASTKILFQKLKEISVEMANSINSNGKSAIYTIEPESNVYNLQYGNKAEFKDLISYKEGKILDYILGSKKLIKEIIQKYGKVYFSVIHGKVVNVLYLVQLKFIIRI